MCQNKQTRARYNSVKSRIGQELTCAKCPKWPGLDEITAPQFTVVLNFGFDVDDYIGVQKNEKMSDAVMRTKVKVSILPGIFTESHTRVPLRKTVARTDKAPQQLFPRTSRRVLCRLLPVSPSTSQQQMTERNLRAWSSKASLQVNRCN